jgi:signal transduction histidine kinase
MKTAMISLLGLAVLTVGCASKKYVGNEIEASETRTQQRIQDLESMVEETQTEIRDLAEELGVKIEGLSAETEALEARAGENEEAIARMGHLSFRQTFSDAEAYFRSDSAELQ